MQFHVLWAWILNQDTIMESLTMRDFMDTLRASGIDTGGPSPLNSRDIQAFAIQLDKFLVKGSFVPEK